MNAGRLPRQSSGAAAVEFALVFPVLFAMLYGLISFGDLLFTQITVSRAVQDGARAVSFLPVVIAPQTPNFTPIKDEIIASLAASSIVPKANNGSLSARTLWLNNNVRSRIAVSSAACAAPSASATCLYISLDFPYGNNDGTRVFHSVNLPGLGGTGDFLPSVLKSQATVRL